MYITPVYAAVFGLLFLVLSVRTIKLRRHLKIAVGAADNPQLLRAMRVHANFAEYVPLTLLLIFLLEAQGGNVWLIHLFCVSLLLGRISHAYGVSKVVEDYRFRVFGISMTFFCLAGSSIGLILLAVLPGRG